MSAASPAAAAYNLADQSRMRRARNYFAWQYRLAAPYLGRRVVEIGCGIGNFTAFLVGREVTAVDPDPACLRALEGCWGGALGLRTVAAAAGDGSLAGILPGADGDCPASALRADGGPAAATRGPGSGEPGSARTSGAPGLGPGRGPRQSFDSCVALNVLEHIADDARALAEMASLVRPGGCVILLVPAFPSLYGPTDRNLGHYRRYRPAALAALAAAAGLAVARLEYINRLGCLAWWCNARLGRDRQSPAQIAVFDRLAPALERLDRLAAPLLPFGLSLFAVLRKAERPSCPPAGTPPVGAPPAGAGPAQ